MKRLAIIITLASTLVLTGCLEDDVLEFVDGYGEAITKKYAHVLVDIYADLLRSRGKEHALNFKELNSFLRESSYLAYEEEEVVELKEKAKDRLLRGAVRYVLGNPTLLQKVYDRYIDLFLDEMLAYASVDVQKNRWGRPRAALSESQKEGMLRFFRGRIWGVAGHLFVRIHLGQEIAQLLERLSRAEKRSSEAWSEYAQVAFISGAEADPETERRLKKRSEEAKALVERKEATMQNLFMEHSSMTEEDYYLYSVRYFERRRQEDVDLEHLKGLFDDVARRIDERLPG